MKGPYDDIIGLPHPTSERHPRMSMAARAAQFSPFAALTGYGDTVKETARLTEGKAELTEEEKAVLDGKLQELSPGKSAAITYFQPDGRKDGGAYRTVSGVVKRMDAAAGEIVFAGGRRIPIEDILEVQSRR